MSSAYIKLLRSFFIVGEVYRSNVEQSIRIPNWKLGDTKIWFTLPENSHFIVLNPTTFSDCGSQVYLTNIMHLKTLEVGLLQVFHDIDAYRIESRLNYCYKKVT